MAGSAFSSALVRSVIRNSRNAAFCTMSMARCGSRTPASSTTMRSSPTFCTTGSCTPNSSTRLRSTVRARSMSRATSLETRFDWSSSRPRCMPPWRSSPSFSGIFFSVVSRIAPSAPRVRIVTSRGKRL